MPKFAEWDLMKDAQGEQAYNRAQKIWFQTSYSVMGGTYYYKVAEFEIEGAEYILYKSTNRTPLSGKLIRQIAGDYILTHELVYDSVSPMAAVVCRTLAGTSMFTKFIDTDDDYSIKSLKADFLKDIQTKQYFFDTPNANIYFLGADGSMLINRDLVWNYAAEKINYYPIKKLTEKTNPLKPVRDKFAKLYKFRRY